MSGISPLELLLPGGRAGSMLVLGAEPPGTLLPQRAGEGYEAVDLVLLLPTRHELRRPGWLAEGVAHAAAAIGSAGVVYVVVPRRWRRCARAMLERAGLLIEPPIAHLPTVRTQRYLVPLRRDVWRYVLADVISSGPRIREALGTLRALPAAESLLELALPHVGLVARCPNGPPLVDWVSKLAGETRVSGGAIAQTSWRGASGSVTLHCFAVGESEPWAVAKTACGERDEGANLIRMGPAARAAGARVPRPLGRRSGDGVSVVVETVVAGRRAADILSRAPSRLGAVAERVAAWLAEWHRATASRTMLDAGLLDRHVLSPATSLQAQLPNAAAYTQWLEARCAKVVGREAPLVAAHNDLTMWNVVLDDLGRIGILDWETAAEQALPLVDLFYALADAVAASDRYRSRGRAVDACFGRGGAHAALVTSLQERVASAVGADADITELAFHSCWLGHAANELRESGPRGPFLEIAQSLARNAGRVSP